ncbi:methyl-CpG-binding domain-containing protein [Cymbomonas tetramitiformis]|uniref:Methyl-CpG-binding domain-containing protein n=1 Tax=Cymbomonas tetramitiformis TaxID=36881 RepID=A0AAE0BQ52_9CHLO|nr:methyl-CpG-binding domain-containing protein [Cymbomonas tetramitiformis]
MELVRGQVGERALRALESDLAQSLLGFRIKMRFASYQEEFWGTVVQKRLQINRGPPRLLFLVVYDDEDYEELDIKSLSEVLVPCSEAQHAAYNALISVARRSSLKVTGKSATLSVVEAQRELFDVEEHGEPPQIADAVREDRAAPDRQDHRTGVSRELPSTVSIPVPGGHLEAIPQTSTPARGAHSAGGSAEAELLAKCDGEVQAEGGSTEVMRLEECDGEGGSTEVIRLEECDGEVQGKGVSTEVMRLEEVELLARSVMRRCGGGGSTEVMRLAKCDERCDVEVRAEGGSIEAALDGEASGPITVAEQMPQHRGQRSGPFKQGSLMQAVFCALVLASPAGLPTRTLLERIDWPDISLNHLYAALFNGRKYFQRTSQGVYGLRQAPAPSPINCSVHPAEGPRSGADVGRVESPPESPRPGLAGKAKQPKWRLAEHQSTLPPGARQPRSLRRGARVGACWATSRLLQGLDDQGVCAAASKGRKADSDAAAASRGRPAKKPREGAEGSTHGAAQSSSLGPSKTKGPGGTSAADAVAPPQINQWVQCDKCSKWRSVPWGEWELIGEEQWYCEMQTWHTGASCDMPEDGWDKGSLFVVMQKGKEDAVPEVPEGWEREVVQRQSGASAQSGVRCDTYYRAPCGKRLRSLPEIQEHHVKHEKQCFRTAAGGRILFEQFRYTNRKESVSLQGCTHRAALPWAKETNWSKRQLEAPSAAPDTTKQLKLEAPSAAPDTTKQRKLEAPSATPDTTKQHKLEAPSAAPDTTKQRKLEAPSAVPDTTKQRKLEAPSATPDTTKQHKLEAPSAAPDTTKQHKLEAPSATPDTTKQPQQQPSSTPGILDAGGSGEAGWSALIPVSASVGTVESIEAGRFALIPVSASVGTMESIEAGWCAFTTVRQLAARLALPTVQPLTLHLLHPHS